MAFTVPKLPKSFFSKGVPKMLQAGGMAQESGGLMLGQRHVVPLRSSIHVSMGS